MRLINADAKTFPTPYKINDTEHAKGWNSCLNSISQQPTIDAEPVRHGHWITYEDDERECYCSNCEFPAGLDAYGYHNMQDQYCRFCGAKMYEENNDETN